MMRMKNNSYLLKAAFACLLTLAFSCSKESNNGPEFELKDVSVNVSLSSGVPLRA